MFLFAFALFGFNVPEQAVCVVDACDLKMCVVETPEGFVSATKREGWYEGKKLPIDECPINLIDPI